jgi:hypothetical protein
VTDVAHSYDAPWYLEPRAGHKCESSSPGVEVLLALHDALAELDEDDTSPGMLLGRHLVCRHLCRLRTKERASSVPDQPVSTWSLLAARARRRTKSSPSRTPSTTPAVNASHESELMSFGIEMCCVSIGLLSAIMSGGITWAPERQSERDFQRLIDETGSSTYIRRRRQTTFQASLPADRTLRGRPACG